MMFENGEIDTVDVHNFVLTTANEHLFVSYRK